MDQWFRVDGSQDRGVRPALLNRQRHRGSYISRGQNTAGIPSTAFPGINLAYCTYHD